MKKEFNLIISITIVLIFGILSIKYQNMIGAIAQIYMPICIIILLHNLRPENLISKILASFGLIILNEFLIRFLGDIPINSDGNPWASLLFLMMLLTSYITIITAVRIKKKEIDNYLTTIVYTTIALLIIAIFYIFKFLL